MESSQTIGERIFPFFLAHRRKRRNTGLGQDILRHACAAAAITNSIAIAKT
jgi:hypothetical protein